MYATGVSAHDIRSMLRSEEWRASQSRNRQLLFIGAFFKGEGCMAVTAAAIGETSMIEGSHIHKMRSKAQTKPKAAHGPLALTEYEEAAVVRLIRESRGSGNLVTQSIF
jgi:hypothetical protein